MQIGQLCFPSGDFDKSPAINWTPDVPAGEASLGSPAFVGVRAVPAEVSHFMQKSFTRPRRPALIIYDLGIGALT